MNKKKIICSVLAAQFSFNFFMGDKIVSADEVLNANPEKEIASEVDNQNENAAIPKDTDEIISNTTEENSTNAEETDVEKDNEKIEANTEEEKLDKDKQVEMSSIDKSKEDLVNCEEESNKEETYYEEAQTLNTPNDEYVWEGSLDYNNGYFDYGTEEYIYYCRINDISFHLHVDGKYAEISSCYFRKSGNLILPNTIKVNGEDYKVIEIEDYAFKDCSNLSSITISDSIRWIGESAFENCSNLSSIVIPDSVRSIDYNAFKDCSSLNSITIPKGVTDIYSNTFENCSNLSNIIMPDSLEEIGWDAFKNCSKLSSIQIPMGVKDIRFTAFSNCINLKEISVDDKNTSYSSEDGVLFNKYKSKLIMYPPAKSDTSYKVPNSVKDIDYPAFKNCSYLSSITIPDSVTNIDSYAFDNCSISIWTSKRVCDKYNSCFPKDSILIESNFCEDYDDFVKIKADSVKAFEILGDGSEKEVSVDKAKDGYFIHDLSKISGKKQFKYKAEIDGVTYESPIKTYDNSKLKEEIIWGENSNYKWSNNKCTINDIEFEVNENDDSISVCSCKDKKLYKVILPDKVKVDGKYYTINSIEENAFDSCEDLGIIKMPDTITDIGKQAFFNCKNLTNIQLPKGLKSISEFAFYSCSNLKNIELPDSLRSIGKNAFIHCNKLSNLKIPNSVVSIDSQAFFNCKNLKSIVIPESVTKLGENVFGYCGNLSNIHVDEKNKNYCDVDGVLFNKSKTKLIKYPEGKTESSYNIYCDVENIDEDAFLLCSKLKNIVVDKNNKNYCDVDGVLFNKNKTQLIKYPQGKKDTNYNIPNGVTTIGYSAFNNCYSLSNITLPNTLKSIGNSAFKSCHELNSVVIPNKVITIGNDAFYNCKSLYSIALPDSLESIGNDAFSYTNLTSVWASKSQFNKFGFRWNIVNIESNLYNRDDYKNDLIKIKGDKVKAVKVINGSKEDIDMTKINDGYWILDPSGIKKEKANYTFVVGRIKHYYHYYDDPDYSYYFSPTIYIQKQNGTVSDENIWGEEYSGYKWIDNKCTINNITFELNKDNSTVSICECGKKKAGDLILPSKVKIEGKYYNVISIKDNAFNSCDKLTTIKIPDGITSIGSYAFEFCNQLNNVELPDTLTNIEKLSFHSCENLKTIKLPSNLKNIGEMAFYSCKSLDNVKLPNKLISIGANAFAYCEGLSNIEIPSSVTDISNQGFYGCKNLKSIIIPEGVKRIGEYAFGECSSLSNINVNQNNKNYCDIDGVLFNKDKTKLIKYPQSKLGSDYSIPEGVTSIDEDAFYFCYKLCNIKIPHSVTSIGKNSFPDSWSLKNIYVDQANTKYSDLNGVLFNKDKTEIIKYPQARKDNNYNIPSNVKKIRPYAFYNCNNLSSVEIPNGVTNIDDSAFKSCRTLKELRIPNTVKSIGDSAFCWCSNLKNVIIPNSVEVIGDSAFESCRKLNSIIIPDSVVSIGRKAFGDCSYGTSVWTSKSQYDKFQNRLGNYCMNFIESNLYDRDNYKDDIIKIKAYSVKAFDVNSGQEVFLDKSEDGYFIHDPSTITSGNKQYRYEAITNTINHPYISPVISVNVKDEGMDGNLIWGNYSIHNWKDNKCTINNIEFKLNNDNASVSICNCENKNINELILPDKIKVNGKYYIINNIEENAFNSCDKLQVVKMPDTITNIGKQAFFNCENLTNVQLSKDLKSISEFAFYSCSNLKNIELPDSLRSIGKNAFIYCNELSNLKIPSGVVSIDSQAFYNCKNLKSIVIPESVTKLGENVFGYCGNLSNIHVDENNKNYCDVDGVLFNKDKTKLIKYPEGKTESSYNIYCDVENIDEDAFLFCSKLENIVVDKNNKNYCDVDGVLFNKNKTQLIKYPQGKKDTNYNIPNGVTTIGYSAFNNCYSLSNIILPNTLKGIGNSAFKSCHKLDSVAIPNKVITIGNDAFYNCSRLYSITLPDSLESIGRDAFSYTNLKPVWTSESQFNKFKDNFKWNSILINSNLYSTSSVKIKGDSVKAFEVLDDDSEREVSMTKDEYGYFIQDLSKVKAGEKHYRYEAVIDGVTYKSPTITVNTLK